MRRPSCGKPGIDANHPHAPRTLIFALPAPIPLTPPGICSVPTPLLEAGQALGATLVRAANGLSRLTLGQVMLRDGETMVDVAAADTATFGRLRRQRVAMLFQQFALLSWRSGPRIRARRHARPAPWPARWPAPWPAPQVA